MKTIKKLIMVVTVSLVLCIIFGLTAVAEETVLYENDFSESGGWVWEDTASVSKGFGSDGAYVSACNGKSPKLVARNGDVKLNFTFDVGKTYEISFLTYTASAAEHRLNFNTGSNNVYIRTGDGRQAVFGENNNSSVAWWADDICNIGQLQSGKTPCWQHVSMRFTVSRIVGGSGDEVANTAVQWMTFSIPWSNESEIKIKDFSIKRIEGIKTEKTIVNSGNAVIGQTPSRAQTVFSKTNIGSVSDLLAVENCEDRKWLTVLSR